MRPCSPRPRRRRARSGFSSRRRRSASRRRASAAFLRPFRFDHAGRDERLDLGPVACSWHDDAVGDDAAAVLRNNNFGPAVVMFSSLMWEDRDGAADGGTRYLTRLPAPGADGFEAARRFEDRIAAQRDRVLGGLAMPFAFVRQTDMRWRVTDADGRVAATDVAQGTVYVRKWGADDADALVAAKTGVVTLETWIRSGEARTVGAWIGFTHFGRSGGRNRGLPEDGEWDAVSKGIRVAVNGRAVPPPKWVNAGLKYIAAHPEEPTSNNIAETPFTNEEYWMREPSRIALDAGWNHVEITLPHSAERYGYDWAATFVPVGGGSDRPREVAGLEYSADPR